MTEQKTELQSDTKPDQPTANGEHTPIAAVVKPPQSAPQARASRSKRKSRARKAVAKKPTAAERRTSRKQMRNFPACSFEEALPFAQTILRLGSGEKVRRLTIFEHLNKSPDSGPSRQLVTNSSKYGLTSGSYGAEFISLTDEGRVAVDPDSAPRKQLGARYNLAIESIEPFRLLFTRFATNKLPATTVMRDILLESGMAEEDAQECIDTFIVNVRFLGLLRTMSGAERLITLDHAMDELGVGSAQRTSSAIVAADRDEEKPRSSESVDMSLTCFYIAPIGDEDSDTRRHSDLFLESIVKPAVEEAGLSIVRADRIGKPGMITAQVIRYILEAKLVVADLSFHNPNVFYELALRHVARLPTVQVIQILDDVPFDLSQFRTIKIDNSSIYSLVPKLDVYRAEIATQIRQVLEDPDKVDNPVHTYCPGITFSIAK